MDSISIKGAKVHNLKGVSLTIPRDALVVVTGVSGSGKSSLAFDTIFKEAQRRYLTTLSSQARGRVAESSTTEADELRGLSPAIALDQKSVVSNPRSTVGTLSEIYDYLRLLFARCSDDGTIRSSNLFSFNSPAGACPDCKGLGVIDRVDPALLVDNPEKSIGEGALRITTPNGYLMYSQVTLEVLDQVCNAHGFHIGIPWKDLSPSQLDVVLNGSEALKVPYGKHPLSSRLKWSGIEAKPREEGFYKGILPVMNDILRRDRNPSILRFVRTVPCETCSGTRLGEEALSIRLGGKNIAELAAMNIAELTRLLDTLALPPNRNAVAEPVLEGAMRRLGLMSQLQLDYLTLARSSASLSGGEAQRLRLVSQVAGELQGILYVLDEPSIGLHPADNAQLLNTLEQLRDNGNSVILVEHDDDTVRRAEWLVDLGPGAGTHGGEVIFSNTLARAFESETPSATVRYLRGDKQIPVPVARRTSFNFIELQGATEHNLRHLDVRFGLGMFNVVTGVSGAGKSTLVNGTLVPAVQQALGTSGVQPGPHDALIGLDAIDKLIVIDQSPIGRTPRSNPATYTKLFDHIRTLFAATETARERAMGKGVFSFNVKGGRCETCQGSGVEEIGMHFLENISVTCDECDGKRFHDDTLGVHYRGRNISEVLEFTVEEAIPFFTDQPKILRFLQTLENVGLSYLTLGQPSTTLSGGEAQRIKLAAHLAKPSTGRTLFILDEPTTGLHNEDVAVLLHALNQLVDAGNTIIAIEHNMHFIKCADRIVDLGPGSGDHGGRLVAEGTPEEVSTTTSSPTGISLADALNAAVHPTPTTPAASTSTRRRRESIEIHGVSTNNLKKLSASIPHGKLTVITGVSGSGKSSLAFDTIHAEGHRRFAESLSTGARRYLKQFPRPPVEHLAGMNATIAIGQHKSARNPRSTVATVTEIYDLYRLLFSRVGSSPIPNASFSARAFSFNHSTGACPTCNGLGVHTTCDSERLVAHPERSLLDGALDGSKTGRFYGENGGRYTAMLQSVGNALGIDFAVPFKELDPVARKIALFGTEDRQWSMLWKFDRKGRRGEHQWDAGWPGFCGLVNEEYERVHGDRRGDQILPVLKDEACPACDGRRLKSELLQVTIGNHNISTLACLSVAECIHYFEQLIAGLNTIIDGRAQQAAASMLSPEILRRLRALERVGLGYLPLSRQTSTLSGGEHQRLLLAARLGSELSAVTYVLDEPTIGLHGRDTERLIEVLLEIRNQGNTVVVVEHDEQLIRAADHLIDMGPGAGAAGGEIVAAGTVDEVVAMPASKTGQYLAHNLAHNLAHRQARFESPQKRILKDGLTLRRAHANNLKHIDVHFPRGGIIAISGVSGSGKSSLAFETLLPSFTAHRPIQCEALEGRERFDQLIAVDQSPIGRTPHSTPATYCGLFDRIRALFAGEAEAKRLGLNKSAFAFASKGGRCETCQGMGRRKIEMGFLSDLWIECDTCSGKRYGSEILGVRHRGQSIAAVLQHTVDQAHSFFAGDKKLEPALQTLSRVGLGYLQLGQPATTLSGGEAQRLKLASELIGAQARKSKSDAGNIYLFDEPTTGLHFEDVSRLLSVFHELADAGHTLIVIEHNLDVIAAADWVIDLGPEAGAKGGLLLGSNTPDQIARIPHSPTGRLLKEC